MNIDCDDEACLVLILVVIGVACIFASAAIPHFWVVATTILWVIMLLVSIRELIYVESRKTEGV
jgi:membrane-bound ClpP family serine protease